MIGLEAAIQGFFLIIVIHLMCAWGIPMWCSFPVKMQAVCLAFWWKGAPLLVFLEYFTCFIIYYVNGCFLKNCPWCLLQYFKYTFYFSLRWEESFLENTLRRLMFDKYLVLQQSFIKRQLCVGNIERFPS